MEYYISMNSNSSSHSSSSNKSKKSKKYLKSKSKSKRQINKTRTSSITRSITIQSEQMGIENEYYIIKCVGEGDYGKVYLATNNEKLYIIKSEYISLEKTIRKEISILQALLNEDSTCNKYILCIYDYGKILTTNVPYFKANKFTVVYEYLDGYNTLHKIKNEHLDTSTKIRVINKLFEGLTYMHEKYIYHRDIHSSNIMYKLEGKGEGEEKDVQIKYIDFGLSQSLHTSKKTANNMNKMKTDDIHKLCNTLVDAELVSVKKENEYDQIFNELNNTEGILYNFVISPDTNSVSIHTK